MLKDVLVTVYFYKVISIIEKYNCHGTSSRFSPCNMLSKMSVFRLLFTEFSANSRLEKKPLNVNKCSYTTSVVIPS